jgi:hypothetical protein
MSSILEADLMGVNCFPIGEKLFDKGTWLLYFYKIFKYMEGDND